MKTTQMLTIALTLAASLSSSVSHAINGDTVCGVRTIEISRSEQNLQVQHCQYAYSEYLGPVIWYQNLTPPNTPAYPLMTRTTERRDLGNGRSEAIDRLCYAVVENGQYRRILNIRSRIYQTYYQSHVGCYSE